MKHSDLITGRKLASGSAVLSALLRILPHPPNFTPVGALSLYSGARMRGPAAWILPLFLMVATDFVLGYIHGYGWFSAVTPFVYGAVLLSVFIGTFLRRTESPFLLGGAALFSSVSFFLITNTGSWLVSGLYEPSFQGLLASLTAGLPFYQYTLAGDLIFSGILFGSHHLITQRWFTEERVYSAEHAG